MTKLKKQPKKRNSQKVNYKRVVMLSIVLLAVIVCISATYITTYVNNKMTPERAFDFSDSNKPSATYKRAEEFTSLFASFDIYTLTDVEPYKDGANIIPGSKTLTVVTTKKDNSVVSGSNFKIQLVLAANWIGYASRTSSTTTVTIGKNSNLTISNIDKIFPARSLLFVNIKHPTLYAYVTWSEYVNGTTTAYYTYLTYSYGVYNRELAK